MGRAGTTDTLPAESCFETPSNKEFGADNTVLGAF